MLTTREVLESIEARGEELMRVRSWQMMLDAVGTYPDPTAPTARQLASIAREAKRDRTNVERHTSNFNPDTSRRFT